jgi:hypothetical protein
MPAKKARKSVKRLKKSKKLEATKPLSGGERPTESVSLNFTKVQW